MLSFQLHSTTGQITMDFFYLSNLILQSTYNIAIANGGAPKEMAELAKKIRDAFPEAKHFWEGEMDATLSTYIGSGVLGACIQFLD